MLKKGSTPEAVSANIRMERKSGAPMKQAVAIAMNEARRTAKPGQEAPAPPPKRKGK